MKKLKDCNLPRTELDRLIDEHLYTERERLIVREKVFDALTYEQIAERHHLSTQRTTEIFYRARERLFAAIEKQENANK